MLEMSQNNSIFKFLFQSNDYLRKNKYEQIIQESNLALITPLKVIAFFVVLSSLFAMLFEIKYHSEFAIEIYLLRVTTSFVAFLILAMMYSKLAAKASIVFVHVLLLLIIISSGIMILLVPSTLVINSQIMGLMIFTSAMFLSWEVKNQILVAIYYNAVFAVAILLNDQRIYFLPNMFESVIFVLFLSFISVVGSAINFRLRLQIAEDSVKIEQSEQKYRMIFNNISEGIFQVTMDGRFITINPAFARMLEYKDTSELFKKSVKQTVSSLPEYNNLLSILSKKESVEGFRISFFTRSKKEIITQMNVHKLQFENNGSYYLEANVQDVTKQVEIDEERRSAVEKLRIEKEKSDSLAKEALRLSGIKTKFLANMSHEIRTPMNGILGFLSLIENESYDNPEELRHYVNTARQSAESLLEIINAVLDLSKIESGRVELDKLNFNLKRVIGQAISIINTKAQEKGVHISTVLPQESELNFVGDATRIRQIFTNLLSNAVKFTNEGEIKIEILTIETPWNKVQIVVSIIDTGIGIPFDKMNELFKPFSQIDGTEGRKFGGTGLGLVITKEFVSMMGGDIKCESIEGHGTKFSFDFFVSKSTETTKQALIIQQEQENQFALRNSKFNISENGEKRKGFKLLLAEDNPINQKVIIKTLNSAGYQIDSVPNGSEAVRSHSNFDYDLILMDVQMPDMDGIEATSFIRKMDGKKRNIPIIAITAHALIGDKEKCIRAGMDEYISKPIKANELILLVDKLLKVEDVFVESIDEEVIPMTKTVFDFVRLEKISGGEKSFELDLLTDYLTDTYAKLELFNTHTSEKNFKKIIETAHTLKGSSYTVGATLVGDEAYGIELSGKNSDIDNVEERLVKLKNAISETDKIIGDYLKKIQVEGP